MNNKIILKYQIFSTIFTLILGSLLHFTYEWSGNDPVVGAFSSVNESTWEHLKLVFFPMLITTIIGLFIFDKNDYKNFLCSKTIGILVSLSFIIVFFYTYTGILGRNIALIDILSFFISVILGNLTTYYMMVNKKLCNNNVSKLVLIVMFLAFIRYTYSPPNIQLFQDPITGSYGYNQE